mmetsp:Transcript_16751/g.40941  ORF Transcript_16751/g.40941 Transcript_16751/m.40941 type:complete len:218 (+) Transcript_16751:74-727(+)
MSRALLATVALTLALASAWGEDKVCKKEDGAVRIVGISGSVRAGSTNTGLLRAAQEAAKGMPGVSVEILDVSKLPHLDNSLIKDGKFPSEVAAYREKIAQADAVYFAVTEYNYAVSGVMKNAIDWAAHGYGNVLAGKPAAMMGSGGGAGTARAQMNLRIIGGEADVHFLNKPEIMIARWWEGPVFDDDGNMLDEKWRGRVGEQLKALVAWARRLAEC